MFLILLPFKIATWLWTYVSLAAMRFVERVEKQILSQVFGLNVSSSQASDTSVAVLGSPEGLAVSHPVQSPTTAIGWALAIYMAWRRPT